jgi:argininosuccinate lyase
MTTISNKIWGGVFVQEPDALAGQIIMNPEQVELDNQLIQDYLIETIAHNLMLAKQKILTKEDVKIIVQALMKLKIVHHAGTFKVVPEWGDLHENIEMKLTDMIGERGRKFHTARSRNDQIETDTRLYLRRSVLATLQNIIGVEEELLQLGKGNAEVVMPGYTHMQHAQPMTFGFWVLSYLAAIIRDWQRLMQSFKRVNINSLGTGAAFGLNYPIDREYVSQLLGFCGLERNSLDTISNRGENIADVMSAISFLFLHLGRMANELMFFTTHEYGYVSVGEEFCTGSSLMPQKRNPDILELVRSQSVIINSTLYKVLELQRNMPSGYNRDQRETKTALSVFKSVQNMLCMMAKLLATVKPKPEKMRKAISENFAVATDVADALVSEYGISFRDAHSIVGSLVRKAMEEDKRLEQISLDTWRESVKKVAGDEIDLSEVFLKKMTDPSVSVGRRNHIGGTAPHQVEKMAEKYAEDIKNQKQWLMEMKDKLNQAEAFLHKEVEKLLE